MTEQSNDKRKINNCQDSTNISEHSKAVNPPEKPAESDDLPLTHTELLLEWLADLTERLPSEVLTPLLLRGLWSLQALPSIPKEISYLAIAVEALPDHDQLNRMIELWEETNRHLGNIEQTLEAIAEKSYPPLPSIPGGQDNRKSRTTEEEEPPGVKRLRKGEKGGG